MQRRLERVLHVSEPSLKWEMSGLPGRTTACGRKRGKEVVVKNGSAGLARRARWLSVPLALPVVALALWLAQTAHFHLLSPAILMAVAGLGVMAALIADAPRLQRNSGGTLTEDPITPERTRVLIVGASESAQRAAREIESSGEHEVIGYAADGYEGVPECMRILGGTDDIPFLVRRFGV